MIIDEREDQFATVTWQQIANKNHVITVRSVEGDFQLVSSSGTLATDMFRHPFAYRRACNEIPELQEVTS